MSERSERSETSDHDTALTRAQSRALSRCAPLTPDEFRARRRVAEQGFISLRRLVGDAREDPTAGEARDR